jgi:hypothetical protein
LPEHDPASVGHRADQPGRQVRRTGRRRFCGHLTPKTIAGVAVFHMPSFGVQDELCLRFSSRQQRRIDMDPRTVRIRALNDELRQNLAGGVAVTTPGVAALGQEAVDRIVKTIAAFDDFCHANDPYEEKPKAIRSFSRSIITINVSTTTRPIRPTPP